MRPPAGARAAAAARSRGPGSAGGAAPPARGPGPLRPPEGRGRRGGRPHSPHTVGAGPPRSTCAATGTGEEQCKARCKRPVGAWPCIAEGCPRATAGGQLDRAGARRGPALAATLPRPAPAGGWTGRAAARRPGWAGVRPAGRWGRVGRPRGPDGSPHHRPQAVAPFPLPAAAASDGGRVWGVTQQQTAAPPLSAAAQGPAWGPLRCGTAADAHGVPGPQSGPRPHRGPVMLIKAVRVLVCLSGAGPPPPLDLSPIYRTLSVPWGDNKGAAPLYPGVAPMLWF